jgi:hypothetical protein
MRQSYAGAGSCCETHVLLQAIVELLLLVLGGVFVAVLQRLLPHTAGCVSACLDKKITWSEASPSCIVQTGFYCYHFAELLLYH